MAQLRPCWRRAAVAATWLVLGCRAFEPEEGPVRVTTDRATYRPGDEVALRLENRGRKEILYGCGDTIERRVGMGWAPVAYYPPPPSVCISLAIALRPGQVIQGRVPLPAELSPGRYRIRFAGGWPSDPFGVVGE